MVAEHVVAVVSVEPHFGVLIGDARRAEVYLRLHVPEHRCKDCTTKTVLEVRARLRQVRATFASDAAVPCTFKVTKLSDEFTFAAFREKNADAVLLFSVLDERLRLATDDSEPPAGSQLVYLS